MKRYSTNLRAQVLASREIASEEAVLKPSLVNTVIGEIADAVLSDGEYAAFSFAFGALRHWEDIAEVFNAQLGRSVQPDSVRHYAGRACRKILATVRDDERLREIGDSLYDTVQHLSEEYRPSVELEGP